MTKQTDDANAVVIERTFDAPLAVVWRLWIDADEFASWYGPEGASIPFADFDVQVGGRRRLCMEVTTPGGPMRMWFGGEYRVVDAPTRLVYTEQITDENGIASGDDHATEVRVELSEVAEGTRVAMTHVGIPSDSPGAVGWQMAFDKLAAHLAS
jgi:uncharacterized protein YndB with AHSA1/START domain